MNGAREHKSNMNKPPVDYAEKVNDKYVNIEKFVKRFVCLTNRINRGFCYPFCGGAMIGMVMSKILQFFAVPTTMIVVMPLLKLIPLGQSRYVVG